MKFGMRSTAFKLICFALLLFVKANSQFYQLKNYNVKDGLPSSDVYAMLQDKSGYLWFTSDMGVSRFNGYEFKNFSTENGLADNTNFGLTEDYKGRIWFRSFSGQLSYYENEKINTPACNPTLKKMIGRAMLTSLYIDTGDTIWAGIDKNLVLKIDPPWKTENARLITIKNPGGYLILFSEENFIYGGSTLAVTDVTVYNNRLAELYTLPIQIPRTIGTIRYTYTLRSDHTYILTANNVLVNFNSNGIIYRKENKSVIIAVLENGNNKILAGTYDGTKDFENYSFTEASKLPNLNKKIITAICRDHENGIWFCTEGNGVFYLPYLNFLYYSPDNGFAESKISCVAKAGNKVVCGHLDGRLSILQQEHIQSLRFNPDTISASSSNRTTTLAYSKDLLYIATIKNIFTLDLSTFALETMATTGSKALIPTADGNLWSLQFNEMRKYATAPSFRKTATVKLNGYSDNIYLDRSEKIWICPTNSIWIWDSTTGLADGGKNIPLLNARIVDVQEDNEGNMWMVSRGSGVIAKKGNEYYSITQKDGLAGNMCRTIFIDSGNVVWVGTNNGLSKIQLKPGKEFAYTITSYSPKNGLLTNEVNDILRHENKLWLIHNNGVSVFDPANIRSNDNPPPVYITGLTVNDDSVTSVKQRTFSHNQNYFNIGFIGISFKDAANLEYRYKMEGVDSNWVYTSYTAVKYQTLPPGDYRFIVYAKNNDGYWSSTPATLAFKILPAWWQTWIFKIIVAFILLMLIFLIFRLRINTVRERDRKKSILQNRIAGIELKALRAQMNPHFVFNSINSVQYFITTNDPDSSQKYLSKFAKLIRYVVDNSKLTSIPVIREIEALTLYLELEALRFGKRFEYIINVHPNVDTEYTQIPSMLIQPYVENSIWHGIMHKEGNGKIEVALEMKGNVLCCIVQDNGIGRKRSMELKQETDISVHTSVGMSNTRERLEIINQVNNSDMSVEVSDVLNEKGEICGTKVEIHIPIS